MLSALQRDDDLAIIVDVAITSVESLLSPTFSHDQRRGVRTTFDLEFPSVANEDQK